MKAVEECDVEDWEESDDDEALAVDVIVDGDILVNFGGQAEDVFPGTSVQQDPCYRESVLLDDVDLMSDSDGRVENESDEEGTTASRKGASVKGAKHGKKPAGQAPVWKSKFTGREVPSLDFSEVSGPARLVSCCKSALDYFMLFFCASIWDLLVVQTNIYHGQSVSAKPSSMPWTDVDVAEMQAFLGLVIAMGVVKLPQMEDYWSTNPILHHPWFRSVMSRDRFKQILRYLHCCDNTCSSRDDKLYKTRSVIDSLNNSFRKMYVPNQCFVRNVKNMYVAAVLKFFILVHHIDRPLSI